jgi:hypothetical protein
MRNAFAVTAALIAAFSSVPYIIGIVRGKTKPDIVTWLTWSVLTGIGSAAAFAAHEPHTALLTVGATCSTATVVVLGLKYGTATISLLDIICQVGAIAGLICWLVFNSPLIGIVVPVCIDLIGALPTLRHSWDRPGEETWQTFLVGAVAPIFTIASITQYSVASLLYPLYLLLADGLIVMIIVSRRDRLGLALAEDIFE